MVCVFVCVCTHVCVCTYICVCVCVNGVFCVYMYVCGVYMYVFVCLSRSSDKTVKVWDASARDCCHTFKEHTDQVSHALTIRDHVSDIYVGIDMLKNYCLYKWYGR